MRTEEEMYEFILNIAKRDERIRAVYMNGSRTNENVPKDIFQDYDVVYVVTDTLPFVEDKKFWQVYALLVTGGRMGNVSVNVLWWKC